MTDKMITKTFIFIFTIILLSCNNVTKEKVNSVANSSNDTTSKDYNTILTEREKASLEKQTENLGELVSTISFNVRTENKKDFEDGLIPWASIEKPENDIPKLVDGKDVVIPESKVTVIVDYPLTNEYRFELESKKGFTKEQLLNEISKKYYKLYEEEESSASVKTIPIDKRTTMYNRNQTNGKYGIWGHDIADLVLSEILVYRANNGQLVLSLNIES